MSFKKIEILTNIYIYIYIFYYTSQNINTCRKARNMPFIAIIGPTLYFFYYILEKYRYRFNDFYSIDFLGLHTNQTFHFQLISIKLCKKTKKEKED